MLLGLAAMFLTETPEKKQRSEHISLKGYAALLKNRTFLLICLSQSIGTFSVGGLAAWMPSYFVRTFEISVARAGFLFGLVTVLAGLAGSFAGGWAADWLRRRTTRAYFVVGYLSFFLSVPFGLAAIMSGSLNTCLVMMFFAEFFVFAYSGPYHAAIVETVPVTMRSMAFALDIFIIHALGDAISPFLLGIVSDAAGLPVAISIAMLYLLFGGVTSILAGEAYKKDFHGKPRGPDPIAAGGLS